MSQNLLKRIITSIILLSLFIFINFSNQYIFIISILILGVVICLETNSLFLNLQRAQYSKKKPTTLQYSFKFIILNIISFCYIFFIFCNLSYEIYRSETPVFFLYVISICFFTDIGGYVFRQNHWG
jgi:phosphatidate cytidylyltransferase